MESLRLAWRTVQDRRVLADALRDALADCWQLACELVWGMKPGFEEAYASYDPQTRNVHLNPCLEEASQVELSYYLVHELRHAYQYQHRDALGSLLDRSLSYVLQYDGTCFRQLDGAWKEVRLSGGTAWWTDLYTNQPHEVDANSAAYDVLCNLVDEHEKAELESLRALWLPRHEVIQAEQMHSALLDAYRAIDRGIKAT